MTASASETEEIILRFKQFFELSPKDRKSSPFSDEPKGMCEMGKRLFEKYCDSPLENGEFLTHINPESRHCEDCRGAFLRHLFLVTNADGH